ncbi:hypothetical protein GCM10023321_21960 [Pseudonocardia eucalypti]|uniref:ABC transporter domain-containing protein n=1 Tax=Pseudonocardia eucalypti TaxID=648755 RepID=A0ABP9PVH2_9PSEU|nr:ABC-type sulfate/molybdate transport systems ATPase subunit [Pseudonocardia eucalypti]
MRARGPGGQGRALPGGSPAPVEFDAVSTEAGGRRVLDRVNLLVPAGRTTAVMGQSGSGKTVLARHLAGDLKPTTGEIRVGGRPLWEGDRLAAAARGFGLLFGANRSYDHFIDRSSTVLENLAGVLRPDRADAAERAAAHARDWHLSEVADRPAAEVDSVTRHRLCLAQAFVGDPALVIVDDPSWAVDINHVDAEVTAIRAWQRRTGGTILLTTHSIMFARALADQVVVLEAGAVRAAGSTADVLRGVVDDVSFERRFGARLSVRESDVERLRALGTDRTRWGGGYYLDMLRPTGRNDTPYRRRTAVR